VNGTVNNPPQLSSVTPNTGTQNGVVALTLSGSNFKAGATVQLQQGATAINGTGINLVSANQIQATFDLTGAPVGAYDVVIKNPDGMEGRLVSAFSVTAQAAQCGAGAGLAMMFFGLMGLISLGGGSLYKIRRKKSAH
jgi:hypothetical protein